MSALVIGIISLEKQLVGQVYIQYVVSNGSLHTFCANMISPALLYLACQESLERFTPSIVIVYRYKCVTNRLLLGLC